MSVSQVILESAGQLDSAPVVSSPSHASKSTHRTNYKHSIAVHYQSNASLLTSGSGPAPNFSGFRNLMTLVLLVSNLRLMIENFQKYGVLINLKGHDYRRQDVICGTILYFSVPCSLLIAYSIECAAMQWAMNFIGQSKKRDEMQSQGLKSSYWRWIAVGHALNATLNLGLATYVVYFHIHHPGIGTICELHAIIVWLKTCSYALTNRDLRHALLSANRSTDDIPELYSTCSYPGNITLSNLSYFWWAPTLVYQPVYPRTDRIRWLFVLKRALEVVGLSIAIWIVSAQYAVPLLQNSLDTITHLNGPSLVERTMKLSSISLFCWLAGFYALFQSGLNMLAELLKFGDRRFYDEWWNAASIREYWTMWNRPVSQFMKRHVYFPLLSRGYNSTVAQLLVFILSAVLHEMAVGVPTHNIIGVAFAGMMFQAPLIFLTDRISKLKWLDGPTIGNVIFWISFVLVGQPLAALLYFFAWQAKYGSVSKPQMPSYW